MINNIGLQYNSNPYLNKPEINYLSSIKSKQNSVSNPGFKGNPDPLLVEAHKIIERHMVVSMNIPNMLTELPGVAENIFLRNIVDMHKGIAGVFSIKLNNDETVKLVSEEIKKSPGPNPILRKIGELTGFSNVTEGLYLMSVTQRIGKKFIEHCQKLKEQA